MRHALVNLLHSFGNCEVIFEAAEGGQVVEAMNAGKIPDVLLLDVCMPGMDGYDTMKWINDHFPAVHVLVLTMHHTEPTCLRLLDAGVTGILTKAIHPSELKLAIESVMATGMYNSLDICKKVIGLLRFNQQLKRVRQNTLTEVEVHFLRLSCSELTYKEIALTMSMPLRSLEQMREQLFVRLNVKSRIGLVLFAMRSGLIEPSIAGAE